MLSVKQKKSRNEHRSYNYIKRLVDDNSIIKNSIKHKHVGKHDTNQLDGEQRHTGFDYHEYDVPKVGTPGWVQS